MKFILTKELGRLAKWLRILGYDTIYFSQENTSSLIIQALRQERIILTRNHRLSKASGIKIVLLTQERIKEQLLEVLKELKISLDEELMFSRCILCNEQLLEIKKEEVKNKVPEYVFKTQDEFVTCSSCKRIYWQGTHWGNVRRYLEEIEGDA